MKVLYCCHADNYHIEKWIPALERTGIELHILTLRPSKKITTSQTIVEPLFNSIRWIDFFSLAATIRQTFLEQKCDVLLCSFASTYGLAGFLSGIKPLIIQTWSRDIGAEQSVSVRDSFMSAFISKHLLSRADGITTDGPHFKKHLLNRWSHINPKKVCSTWWGIDVDFWLKNESEKHQTKEKWGIPNHAPVLISPRGVFWYYRPQDVLSALLDILSLHPDLFVLLPTLNHARPTEIQDLINQLKEHPRVRVADSFLEPDVFREWIQLSDFLLSVPLFDGISEVIQEGMLCGAIPILNPIEANRVLLNEGGCGFLTESAQPKKEALVQLIQQVLNTDKSVLDSMRTQNRAFIENQCNVGKTARKLADFMSDIHQSKK